MIDDAYFNRIITYQMVWIKVNQIQLAVDSLQLPQSLFLKINHLLDTPYFFAQRPRGGD